MCNVYTHINNDRVRVCLCAVRGIWVIFTCDVSLSMYSVRDDAKIDSHSLTLKIYYPFDWLKQFLPWLLRGAMYDLLHGCAMPAIDLGTGAASTIRFESNTCRMRSEQSKWGSESIPSKCNLDIENNNRLDESAWKWYSSRIPFFLSLIAIQNGRACSFSHFSLYLSEAGPPRKLSSRHIRWCGVSLFFMRRSIQI